LSVALRANVHALFKRGDFPEVQKLSKPDAASASSPASFLLRQAEQTSAVSVNPPPFFCATKLSKPTAVSAISPTSFSVRISRTFGAVQVFPSGLSRFIGIPKLSWFAVGLFSRTVVDLSAV